MQESERKTSSNMDAAVKVFAEHADFIRSVIRSHVKDEVLGDDLFQDLFLALVVKPIPTGVVNLESYLYKAIGQDVIDVCRRTARYKTEMSRYAKRKAGAFESGPENVLIDAEETRNISRIIRGSLPLEEARAVTLRYRDNYDTEEVAQKMGVDPRSVSRYISVGLKRIRRLLEVSQEYRQLASKTPEKMRQADEQKTEEKVSLNVSVGDFSPEDEVARGIVNLYRALNSYYIASGGSGLVVDDWGSFVSTRVPAEVV